MEKTTYEQWNRKPPRRRDAISAFGAVIALLIAGGLIMAVLFPPIEGVKTGVPVSRKISTLNYPATISQSIGQPVGGTWLLPTSVAMIDGTKYVLDTGNNRILALDSEGRLVGTLDGTSDPGLDLRQPMAITTDGGSLFVANALAGQIVVLNTAGSVQRVISLETPPAGDTPRPIGVVVSPAGHIIVSDANNHRVLILSNEGGRIGSFGTGTRTGGSQGLNVPGGLAVDAEGYIYVVDTLNGRVVKLSPEGEFIRDFASLADTAGSLARPKGVAVDGKGRIFVSDGLQAAIEVFGPNGDYLGVIGRRDTSDPSAGSIFETPAGLTFDGERLVVVDGALGLIVLQLPVPAAYTGDKDGG
ncbi:MAG: NHL repeat-containing protein [Dehalococcoidia bacterium]